MITYLVKNNGAFYKKGTVLIRHEDGLYAPSEADYPKHCHFLTAEYMDGLPKVFLKGASFKVPFKRTKTEWTVVPLEEQENEIYVCADWDRIVEGQKSKNWNPSKFQRFIWKVKSLFTKKSKYRGRSL